ncbi:VTT domain-containing protein [Neobacillus cucumis]|uniref:VTT domain-containing protein n=1 Tax=Neobacillus cucumis TaxID=1740721 RepID=UPI0018E023D7|nr:VTT domain-containing protein [Neobacillus cucumis]MBI0576994.1 VTT domain-containing protein [Neobacillus cucumis]WHY93992.1 VTT domain-containing protein [Neobacillus cucumis]
MHYLTSFMNDYGYLVLFLSLILGIMALPIPIEALMGYAGFLAYQGQLNWLASVLSASVGCLLGMMIAYWIGAKLGMPFFEKYGSKIHLGPERLNSTSIWFKKYGNKLLIVALFIPGVRHITGYFSGITRLPFIIFSIFSAIGSVIWVSTFILLGKMLGPKWGIFHEIIKKYLIIGSMIIVVLLVIFYLFKKFQKEMILTLVFIGKRALEIFHTRRRTELFLAGISLVTLGFIILMINLIQNYLENDINDLDTVINMLISIIFKNQFDLLMNFFLKLGTATMLISIIFYTLLWIIWKGKDKLIELYFLFIAVAGGEIYEEILRNVFHRLSPDEPSLLERFPYSFPSEQSLMSFVIYGFFFFIMLRHSKYLRVHTILIVLWIVILLFMGISRIYFHVQDPSQIAAGYVFGGVWLGLTTMLLEIFRLLTTIDSSKKRSRIRV